MDCGRSAGGAVVEGGVRTALHPRPRAQKTSALPGPLTLDAYLRRITLRAPLFPGLCSVGRFSDLLHLTDGAAPAVPI